MFLLIQLNFGFLCVLCVSVVNPYRLCGGSYDIRNRKQYETVFFIRRFLIICLL
jgi:hypothetical protein